MLINYVKLHLYLQRGCCHNVFKTTFKAEPRLSHLEKFGSPLKSVNSRINRIFNRSREHLYAPEDRRYVNAVQKYLDSLPSYKKLVFTKKAKLNNVHLLFEIDVLLLNERTEKVNIVNFSLDEEYDFEEGEITEMTGIHEGLKDERSTFNDILLKTQDVFLTDRDNHFYTETESLETVILHKNERFSIMPYGGLNKAVEASIKSRYSLARAETPEPHVALREDVISGKAAEREEEEVRPNEEVKGSEGSESSEGSEGAGDTPKENPKKKED